jgi:hypothetical protein
MPVTPLVLEIIKTLAAVAVPVVVALVGYRLSRRLKLWEAGQWRNQELIKARLQYYGQIAPMVNDLMCYLAFVGRWKELAPPDVIAIKRDMDRLFHSVAPLFSQRVADAYGDFMRAGFSGYSGWATDARIRSGAGRRREAWSGVWDAEWEHLFATDEAVGPDDLARVLDQYNRLLGALAGDIGLSEPRERYAAPDLVTNAH